MRRTQENAEKTKQDIINAGIKVFAQNGYFHTNLVDIAKLTNLSRGAIYWHFKNKETLFIEITKNIYNEIICFLEEKFDSGSTIYEKIENTLKNICYQYLENEDMRKKRKLLISTFFYQDRNDILSKKTRAALFSDQDISNKNKFFFMLMNSIKNKRLPGQISETEITEDNLLIYFMTIIVFTEGLISSITHSPKNFTREMIDKIITNFLDGFFYTINNFLEEK